MSESLWLLLPPQIQTMKISPSKFTSWLRTDETSLSPKADFFPTHWEGKLRLQVQLSMILGPNRCSYSLQSREEVQEASHWKRLQRRGKRLNWMFSYPEVKVTAISWSMWLQHSSHMIHRMPLRHCNNQYSHSTQPSRQGIPTTHLLCDLLYVNPFYNMLVFSCINWK